RRVNDLPAARGLAFKQRSQDSGEQQHRTTAKVADQVQRRRGWFTWTTYRVQNPGQAEVVDVVARGPRQRTILAPTGHPAVHQGGVASAAHVWSEAEASRHARP